MNNIDDISNPTTEATPNDNPQLQSKCHKNCTYFNPSKHHWIARWIFLGVMLIASILAVVFYLNTQRKFADSHAMIVKHHNEFCKSLKFQDKTLAKDSVMLLDNTLLNAIKEENLAITSQLELQYHRINDNYSILTLWASSLMIVFLVFSIYSMYKIDEMQQQGRDSLSKIYQLHQQSQEHSTTLEKRMSESQDRVIGTAKTKMRKEAMEYLEEVRKSLETQQSELKDMATKLGSYKDDIAACNKEIDGLKENIGKKEIDFTREADAIKAEFIKTLGQEKDDYINAFKEEMNAIAEQAKVSEAHPTTGNTESQSDDLIQALGEIDKAAESSSPDPDVQQ